MQPWLFTMSFPTKHAKTGHRKGKDASEVCETLAVDVAGVHPIHSFPRGGPVGGFRTGL